MAERILNKHNKNIPGFSQRETLQSYAALYKKSSQIQNTERIILVMIP